MNNPFNPLVPVAFLFLVYPRYTFNQQSSVRESADKAAAAAEFKPKSDSRSCEACHTSNEADAKYCACFEHPNDDIISTHSSFAQGEFHFPAFFSPVSRY